MMVDDPLEQLREWAKRLPPKARELLLRQIEDLEKAPPEAQRRRARHLLDYLESEWGEETNGESG